ncbi:hypothetical protein BGZ83_000726 [Gryganskiella cystojenkinii]|nr:hypothetical protein BGZ83_000726 [Gryganskiella cystojenkinii]
MVSTTQDSTPLSSPTTIIAPISQKTVPKQDNISNIDNDDKNTEDPLHPTPEQIRKLDLISPPPVLHINNSPHKYNSDATNANLEQHSSPFALSHATATEIQNKQRLETTTVTTKTNNTKPNSRKNSLTTPLSANSNSGSNGSSNNTASLPPSLFQSSSSTSTTPYYTLAASTFPPNASTQVHYYTESPIMIEMKQFGVNEGASSITSSSPSAIGPATGTTTAATASNTVIEMPGADYHDLVEESKKSHPIFRGWLQIPPSLAGRPTLTPEQEQRLRYQIENGPVELMRAHPQRRDEIYGEGHVKSGDDTFVPQDKTVSATGSTGGYFSRLWGMTGSTPVAKTSSPASMEANTAEAIATVPAPVTETAAVGGGDRDSRRGAMGV